MLKTLLYCFLLLVATKTATATTYYVSANGNDANTGTSISKAWASITKVNKILFVPGDVILFEGGATFYGGIYFGSQVAGTVAKVKGTADKPIVLSSYGTGRAILRSGTSNGFFGYNTAGFTIKNLIFKGPDRTQLNQSGIYFYTDVPGTLLSSLKIENVEVSGFRDAGIKFGSWNQTTGGFSNVSVINSKIHDNGHVGITSFAKGRLVHKNMLLRNNKVYNHSGQSEDTYTHTGSGIMLSEVNGATVEYCEAYNNGWLNTAPNAGPQGIWGFNCNNLIIQRNESHHNKTGSTKDGGGFDLDGGCTNSIMQYNYSHDNDGGGFVIAQYTNAPAMKSLTVRYNISENDGRKNDYAGLHLWSSGSNGGIQDAHIYNNVVYTTPKLGASPKGIMVRSGGLTNVRIRNNILQTTGGVELVRVNVLTGVRLEGNNYWSSGATFKIVYAGTTYSSLTQWRTATGQEKINGTSSGYSLSPGLSNPGQGVTIGNPQLLYTLNGYKLKSTSAMIGKGLDLAARFSTNIGKQDFFNNDITQSKTFSIGAHQPNSGSTTAIASLATASSRYEPGLTEEPVQNVISMGILPNPVQDRAVISFAPASHTSFSLELINTTGALVRRIADGTAEAGNVHQYTLDASSLAKGIYLIKLTTDSQIQVKKIMIEP